MGELDRAYEALRKADAAGNVEDAQRLTTYIRSQQQGERQSSLGMIDQAERDGARASELEVGYGESAFRGAADLGTGTYADEIAGASGAGLYALAKGARSLLPGGVPEESPGVADVYRQIRDEYRQRNEAASDQNPVTYYGSGGAALLAETGTNPLSLARGGVALGKAALSPSTYRALFSRAAPRIIGEGVKQAAKGAATGAAVGLGSSEADLTRGEFEEAGEDIAEGAELGGKFGFGLGVLGRAGQVAASTRGAAAASKVPKAREVEAFEKADQEFPAQLESAKGARKAAQESAKVAAKQPREEIALQLLGLDDAAGQRALGGSRRAASRAQELYREPLAPGSSQTVLDDLLDRNPSARLDRVKELLDDAAKPLSGARDALAANRNAFRRGDVVRQSVDDALGEFPLDVQQKARSELEAILSGVEEAGRLRAPAIRKLIKEMEGRIKYASPTQNPLGQAAKKVYQNAREALVRQEKALVAQHLPEQAEAYNEGLRRYSVLKDFEKGSSQILTRSNSGKAPIKYPKPSEEGIPDLPNAPNFPGGTEAYDAAVAELSPLQSRIARDLARHIGAQTGAAAGGNVGGYWGVRAGSSIGRKLADLLARGIRPSAEQIAGKAAKFQKYAGFFEDTLKSNPEAVRAVHAYLLENDSGYREALDDLASE